MAQVKSLAKSYHSLKARLANVKEKSDKVVKSALHAGEAVGTAALFGYIRRKRQGEPLKLGPVPLSLAVAGALTGAALMDFGGSGDHLMAVATGAGCAWAYEEALGPTKGLTKIKGLPTDDEVAAAIQS